MVVTGSTNVSLLRTTDGTLQRSFPATPKFSADGRRLAYYVYTGTQSELQVFSVADGSLVGALPATNSAHFAFLADNDLLVVSEGSLVRVWSLSAGQVVRTFTGHNDDPAISITGVYASPKDDRVVSIDSYPRRRAILWSATTASILATIDLSEGYHSAQFTPNGDEFAIARISNAHVNGGAIEFSQFWRTSDGALAAEIQPAHRGWVRALGFSPDSRHVATGAAGGDQGDVNYQQQHFVLWPYDTRVQVWQVSDGAKEAELLGAASAVTAVAISSAGVVAGGAAEGTLHFWRLPTGEHLNEVNIGSGIIWSLAFSPDGSQIAVATEGGTVSVWSVPDGSPVALLESSGDSFTSVVWSPDGHYVAGGAYHGTPTEVDTRLWSATDGSLIRTFFGAGGSQSGLPGDMPGMDLKFSPAGDRLLIGTWSAGMRLVKVADGKIARIWSGPAYSPSFAADGIHILVSNPDYSGTTKFGAYAYGALEWCSTTNASRLYRHVAECNRISVAAVSPNGLYYAVGREDGTLFLARSPVAPWTLQVTPAAPGGGLTLSWSADLAGFALQSATTLTNGGDWQDSSLTPATVGNQKIVTVDTTNTAGFFRLRGP